MNRVLFSSKTAEWGTPGWLFKALSDHYGSFVLDPAATPYNALCVNYYTKDDDGLAQPWAWAGRIFLNPPYGREIGRWVEKAAREAEQGCMVVCLLPARTDTRWFHEWCTLGEVFLLPGRLQFVGAVHAAPFPSMIVVFGHGRRGIRAGYPWD